MTAAIGESIRHVFSVVVIAPLRGPKLFFLVVGEKGLQKFLTLKYGVCKTTTT